jgi:lysine biosynthesis protein LysW
MAGEIILCSSCGTELEVINLEPTELDWVYLDPIASGEE